MLKSFFDRWFQKMTWNSYTTVTEILARSLVCSVVLGTVGMIGLGAMICWEGSPLWIWLFALTFAGSVLVIMTSGGFISGLNRAAERAAYRRAGEITRKTDSRDSWP